MEIKVIEISFSVCKIEDIEEINFQDEYCFVGKTDQELSLVCNTKYVPKNAFECDNGWRAFRIEGILDFSLIGILSGITTILAENKIGVFAISTYNTDYILTKDHNFEKALEVLENNGYIIIR